MMGDADMHAIDMKADQAAPFRAPEPGSIPVPVPEHESLHTYVQRARNISIFSIVFTLVCAVCGLTFAWSTKSSALLGYGLEALVDVWSSILVLWRFWSDPDGEGQYFLVTKRREDRASVGIAFTFVIIAYATCFQAAIRLIEHEEPANSEVLLVISGTSVIILSWSCAMKFSLAKVLKSSALRKDAVTSGACAAMAATILISTTIYKSHDNVWWLDSVVAIVISFGLFVLGIRTLLKNPWWRRDFWKDGDLPQAEQNAAHIMELPFHSPRRKTQDPAFADV